MKKVIVYVVLFLILLGTIFLFTGCTLKVETTDNSVSASVDGETTEKVDSIKERINRVFNTEEKSEIQSA